MLPESKNDKKRPQEEREQGKDPYAALESIMPWEDVVNSIEEAKQLSRPMDYDYLDLLKNRFTYLRKYTPTLLDVLEFTSTKSGELFIICMLDKRNNFCFRYI